MAEDARRPAERLRQERQARGWRQADVARELRALAGDDHRFAVDGSMVSRWERGERLPTAVYALLLSQLFERTLGELGLAEPTETERRRVVGEEGDAALVWPLRRERQARGWSMDDVIEKLNSLADYRDGIGVTSGMVSGWERRVTRPNSMYVRLLCMLYEKTAEELGLPAETTGPHEKHRQVVEDRLA